MSFEAQPPQLNNMAMEYINYLRAKAHLASAEKSEKPVLSDEDEQFLNRITSQGDEAAPPLPARPAKDAQLALMDGAQNVKLPETPTEEVEEPEVAEGGEMTEQVGEKADGKSGTRKRTTWSWMRRDSRDGSKKKNQEAAANSLMDVAEGMKTSDAKPNEEGMVDDKEAEKEEEDMTIALERLNLAAVNNRVFSLSAETQELLQKFNLIFKDLVNGVPTAYDDLEKLLTNSDRQLQGLYKSLPNFLQKLIETLPNKMTTNFAPEIMAAAAERATMGTMGTMGGMSAANAGRGAGKAAGRKIKIPTLKELIGKPGAAATMLRSIIQFLRARFPAFMGMNVLWSMAVFGKFIHSWIEV